MKYKEVFEKIVESVKDMIGKVAIPQANKVEEVSVDDQGKVTEGEIDSSQVVELITTYEGVMGDGAIAVTRNAVKELYEKDESVKDLDLPEEVLPKEVKAEKFVSAF